MEIWENDPAFKTLRSPVYKGRCVECEYSDSCGGCRARALAARGDLMAEDPWCTARAKGVKRGDRPARSMGRMPRKGSRTPLPS
ncbi:MAG: hypothetical protein HS130_09035 [Deltaproteobacteria bacterium]|nr:hypothetical protein [Deltaproteobacteria bacterium]